MSNYLQVTLNPKTGMFETAEWLDDYYGLHQYGVRFSDGGVYDPILVELETKDIVTEVSEHSATDSEPSTSIASMPSEVDTLDEILATAFGEKTEGMWDPSNGRVTFPKAKAKLSALLVDAHNTAIDACIAEVKKEQEREKDLLKLVDRIKELQQGASARSATPTALDKQVDTFSEDTINKIESLIGEVQALYNALDTVQKLRFHWTPGLAEEAEEWVSELVATGRVPSRNTANPPSGELEKQREAL